MKTVSVKIQIPDNMELACDEVRAVQPGEYFLDVDGVVMLSRYSSQWKHPIVREAWKPPEFLKPGWIAMDTDEFWCWYMHEPRFDVSNGEWESGGPLTILSHLNFTPPPCSDPKLSLRRIE
jgi:hypothetical protein